jgi:hypothetical protein
MVVRLTECLIDTATVHDTDHAKESGDEKEADIFKFRPISRIVENWLAKVIENWLNHF